MNKTVTINLSGIVFHIDENAYEQLKQYLDRLKGHFASTQGRDEIISDIEGRLAEMFSDKVGESKNVITLDNVNSVIAAMGKPEDLIGEEEEKAKQEAPIYYQSTTKRFFRNPDDKILGGVASGIAAYFDIDPVWIRLAFVLMVLAGASGILIYIILWIIIPEARTASDKLQMRGEPVNVQAIEKNVREEMENLRKRGEAFISSDQIKTTTRSAGQKVGGFFGELIRALGKLIVVFFAVIITLISVSVLIGLTVAIFTGAGVMQFAIPHVITGMVLSTGQIWWLTIGAILAIGIPFTMLLLNGLKLLFKLNLNLKMIGAVMAGLWLIGIGICVFNGIRIGSEFSDSATIKQKQLVSGLKNNKVYLKATKSFEGSNDEDWDNYHHRHIHFGTGDLFLLSENSDSVLSHLVRVDVEQSDNDSTYLIEKISSCGRTYDEAKRLASNTSYRYTVSDSVVQLQDYFKLNTSDKYRGQMVKVILMLPVGKSVVLDRSLGDLLDDVHNVTNTWDGDMLGHEWTMTKDGLKCNQCPNISDEEHNEDDNNDNHNGASEIKIDSNGIDIKTM